MNEAQKAIAAIQSGNIITVWSVSHQRRDGRRWENVAKHYLSYAKACEERDAMLRAAAAAPRRYRNVSDTKPHNVFTHE
jgi:hypothetical protein